MSDILDQSVREIVELLPAMTDAELADLRELEEAGKTRTSLITAIDHEIVSRETESPAGDEAGGAEAGTADEEAESQAASLADEPSAPRFTQGPSYGYKQADGHIIAVIFESGAYPSDEWQDSPVGLDGPIEEVREQDLKEVN